MSVANSMTVKRPRTELTPSAYKALVISADKQEPSPWALDAVRYASVGEKRMLELFYPEFSLGVPLLAIHELKTSTVKDLQTLRLSPAGDTIIVDCLDAHISVEGLLKILRMRARSFLSWLRHFSPQEAGKEAPQRNV